MSKAQPACRYDEEQMIERRANACEMVAAQVGLLGRMLGDDDEYGQRFATWSSELEAHARWLRGEVDSGPAAVSVIRLVH